MQPTPFAYVTSGGVANTTLRQSEDDAALPEVFAEPMPLTNTVAAYRKGDREYRSNVKKKLWYFVGGTFGKPTRHNANVKSRTMLTLDVEQAENDAEPPPPLKVVVARLRKLGYGGWIYTTISHTHDCPRYRVVLVLAKAITGANMAAILEASTRAAARMLEIEQWTQPESWVLSQAMYGPAKLKGSTTFAMQTVEGKPWPTKAAAEKGLADIPERVVARDPVIDALHAAGLYLGEDAAHKGKHYITCPFHDQHKNENPTQTVYYEANHCGYDKANVKCFDTAPDEDGKKHLTYGSLVAALRKDGHLANETAETKAALEDYAEFNRASDMQRMLNGPEIRQEWAIEQTAPIGQVAILGGPGGQGKLLRVNLVEWRASIWMRTVTRQVDDAGTFDCRGPV